MVVHVTQPQRSVTRTGVFPPSRWQRCVVGGNNTFFLHWDKLFNLLCVLYAGVAGRPLPCLVAGRC